MDHALRLLFVLYFLLAQAALLSLLLRCLRPTSSSQPHRVRWGLLLAILAVQPLVPLGWFGLGALFASLSEPHLADLIAVSHLAFMAGVLLFPLLVLLGGGLGWSWVRRFWLRLIHLLTVLLVVMQPIVGHECPINEFERTLRGGELRNLQGASPLGAWANQLIYTRKPLEQLIPVYLSFAAVVVLSWLLVRPEPPGALPPGPNGSVSAKAVEGGPIR
ncbi:MAG: DUF2784 family protein [Gemmataceae bacterium]